MSRDVSFSLDLKGGQEILTNLVAPVVKQSAEAIAARGNSIAASISSDPPPITVETSIGTIKRGMRAIATVRANGRDAHQNYIGHVALSKSIDAGRVS